MATYLTALFNSHLHCKHALSFDNVHILLYDDFAKNTASELRSIFKFLNLNENIEINYKRRTSLIAKK